MVLSKLPLAIFVPSGDHATDKTLRFIGESARETTRQEKKNRQNSKKKNSQI
jgi:hypothetical protein